FFSSRRRHTRFSRDWSSDVCSSDLSDIVYTEEKTMKKTALTMAISSVLLAGGAQAATVYDQNDTKLEIGGRAQGMYYGTDNKDSEGDQSYFRLHIAGETKIDNE